MQAAHDSGAGLPGQGAVGGEGREATAVLREYLLDFPEVPATGLRLGLVQLLSAHREPDYAAIADETEKWRKVIREANIKPE